MPSAANIRRYAEIVRERSILRKLVAASDEIATSAFNPQGRPVDADPRRGRAARSSASARRARASKQGFQSMDQLVVAADRPRQRAGTRTAPKTVTGVRTGFYDLDRMTAGLQAGDLIVLAARPSMGKTALALNIAEHVAVNEGLPVVVFSMEMGASQLALRMVGSLGRIDQQHLRTGALTRRRMGAPDRRRSRSCARSASTSTRARPHARASCAPARAARRASAASSA